MLVWSVWVIVLVQYNLILKHTSRSMIVEWVVHDIFQVLGKGSLTYGTCVYYQMYFCTIKICLNHGKYYYKSFQKQNLCAKYMRNKFVKNIPEIYVQSSMSSSLSLVCSSIVIMKQSDSKCNYNVFVCSRWRCVLVSVKFLFFFVIVDRSLSEMYIFVWSVLSTSNNFYIK